MRCAPRGSWPSVESPMALIEKPRRYLSGDIRGQIFEWLVEFRYRRAVGIGFGRVCGTVGIDSFPGKQVS